MKQIDRLIIKAKKLHADYGGEVAIIRYDSGQWVTDDGQFSSLEEAQSDILEKSKGEVLFIVNDIGAPGPRPLWAAVTKQKARMRRRWEIKHKKQKKMQLERAKLERLKRIAEKEKQERFQREKQLQEKQTQMTEFVGKVI